MGLKITISEIIDEENEISTVRQDDEPELDWDDEEVEEETDVVLTGHTVTSVRNIVEDVFGRNMEQSRAVNAIEICGKFNIADRSKEHSNLFVFFDWFKRASHNSETYKRIEVSQRTGGNIEYENVTFEKAFVVSYWEKGTNKKGTVEFQAIIRRFNERIMPVGRQLRTPETTRV